MITPDSDTASSHPDPGEPAPIDTSASGSSGQAPGFPADASTLSSTLTAAGSLGYGGQLTPHRDGTLTCDHCGTATPAGAVPADRVERLEGASDAADLLLVATLRCPACGQGGTVVLGYGPNASEEDAAVAVDLDLSGATPIIT